MQLPTHEWEWLVSPALSQTVDPSAPVSRLAQLPVEFLSAIFRTIIRPSLLMIFIPIRLALRSPSTRGPRFIATALTQRKRYARALLLVLVSRIYCSCV